MRLDDSNRVPLDYIFSYTLTAIYKISLNGECVKNRYVASISERRKYMIVDSYIQLYKK